MTTYSYTLVLDDGEISMLEEALKLLIDHCSNQIKAAGPEGPEPPFIAFRGHAYDVKARLHERVAMTSTYSGIGKRPLT